MDLIRQALQNLMPQKPVSPLPEEQTLDTFSKRDAMRRAVETLNKHNKGQNVLGEAVSALQGKGQKAEAAEAPAPTPADSQFSDVLAPLENDPGGQYNRIIEQAADEYGVPASLLKAVLARESAQFQEKYVKGYHTDGTGRGIAGIDKKWHPHITDEQAFNPEFAIPYAANLLKGYHKQEGDFGGALRRYNGGGNYDSDRPGYAGVPVKQRTMDYLNNVYEQSKRFSGK